MIPKAAALVNETIRVAERSREDAGATSRQYFRSV
jgi:hypothetical protein